MSSTMVTPVPAPTRRRATEAEYEALPEGTRAELLGYELFLLPAPGLLHQRIISRMVGDLDKAFGESTDPDGWIILAGPEVKLGPGSIVIPDLAGWRRERLPKLPHAPRMELIPDWVCEVFSPSNARHDVIRKAPRYLDAGLKWLWWVSPTDRYLEALEARDGGWQRIAGGSPDEGPVVARPFEALPLDLNRWFAT